MKHIGNKIADFNVVRMKCIIPVQMKNIVIPYFKSDGQCRCYFLKMVRIQRFKVVSQTD